MPQPIGRGSRDAHPQASSSDASPAESGGWDWEAERRRLGRVLKHPLTEAISILTVCASLLFLIIETDATAPQSITEAGKAAELHIFILNQIFIGVFVVELILNLYVSRWAFFTSAGTLNFLVTVLDTILGTCEFFLGSVPQVAMFRSFRLIRVLRLLKVVKFCPELDYLIRGIASAFVTVMWGAIMIVLMLLVFSLLAVQVLHPINLEVASRGTYDNCPRCPQAFSSVWNSLLTFTQTLIFGDSWGMIALPIVEDKWWAIVIFLFAFASVVLAAMNLILAAIVDSGAVAREAVFEAKRTIGQEAGVQQRRERVDRLVALCARMDATDSGCLSKEQLLSGFDRNQQFREDMEALDFTRTEMEIFFNALDRDCRGYVDYTELLGLMRDAKMADLHQMVIFVKYAVMDLWSRREREELNIQRQLQDLAKAIDSRHLSCCDNEASVSPRTASQTQGPQQPKPQQQLKPTQSPRPQQPQSRRNSNRKLEEPKDDFSRQSSPEALPKSSKGRKLEEENSAPEVKHNPQKEAKSLCHDVGLPTVVGQWYPLEAPSPARPPGGEGGAPPTELQLQQEMVQALHKISQETERHSHILTNLDRTVSGHASGWSSLGGSAADPVWAEPMNVVIEGIEDEHLAASDMPALPLVQCSSTRVGL